MIWIGPLQFKVFLRDRMEPDFHHPLQETEIQLGEVDWLKTQIVVLSSLEQQQQKLTLWHEIFHTLGESEGLSDSAISRLSSGVYAVLIDNALLVDGWWDKIIDEEKENTVDDHYTIGEID